jgi:hypothetical protein
MYQKWWQENKGEEKLRGKNYGEKNYGEKNYEKKILRKKLR